MSVTITMSSKGQFTLPAKVRKAMALHGPGDKLVLDFNSTKQQATLSRPVSIEDIQSRSRMYMKPGVKPLTSAGALYDTREPRL